MKVYVASSWRNEEYQQGVVHILEDLGHEIYDFRNPPPGEVTGFHWRELDPKWEQWDPKKAREALDHPTALKNYDVDKRHLDWADICVYVTPCGKSASWEAGYMAGQGKTVIVLLNEGDPELMYKLADFIVTDYCELIDLFQGNLIIKAETWLKEQFEHELCAECGGDAGEHTAVPMFGNWFARCDQPAKK